jgi:hypothetical protein
MLVPCIIRRTRNDEKYALICTTPLASMYNKGVVQISEYCLSFLLSKS